MPDKKAMIFNVQSLYGRHGRECGGLKFAEAGESPGSRSDAAGLVLQEPPYAEPHVRWYGRTARVTQPPTRLSRKMARDNPLQVLLQ